MWECPKCGRKFKNTNQSHYCGTAPQSIEEYIAQQPEYTRLYLCQINEVIQNALPDAVQKISWSMPTYWKKRNRSSLRYQKNTSGCIPALRRWKPLQTGCKDTKPAKEPSNSPMTSRFPLT